MFAFDAQDMVDLCKSHPLEFRGKKLKKLRKSCGKVAEKLRDLLSEFC